MAAFPRVGLHAAQTTDGVVAKPLHVGVVPDGAVVGAEKQERVFAHSGLVERLEHTPDHCVHHHQKITEHTGPAAASKLGRG